MLTISLFGLLVYNFFAEGYTFPIVIVKAKHSGFLLPLLSLLHLFA